MAAVHRSPRSGGPRERAPGGRRWRPLVGSHAGRGASTALLTHAALIQAITFLLRPAATYRAIELDAPAVTLGALGAAFAIVPLILAVPLGRMVDRLGERRLMLAGAIVTLVSCILFVTVSQTLMGVVLATATLGAGHLGCVIGQQALVANSAPPGRLDTMFGYYTFAASLGQSAGPLVISLYGRSAATPDTSAIFLIATGMAAALVVATAPLRSTAIHSVKDASAKQASPGIKDLLRTRGLLRALVTSAVILSAVDLTLVYLPALGAERDLSAATVGALLTVRAVFSMISRILLGRLARRMGRTRLMIASILVSTGSLVLVPLPMPTWLLMLAIAMLGLGLGVGQPLTMSWLTQESPPGMRGRALSLRLAGNRIGQVAIPTTLGTVAAGLGAAGVLWATAIGVGATTLLIRGINLDSGPEA